MSAVLPIQEHDMVKEARRYVERAQGYIDTLDLGPLDYNVGQAVDVLRAAALTLEALLVEIARAEGRARVEEAIAGRGQ